MRDETDRGARESGRQLQVGRCAAVWAVALAAICAGAFAAQPGDTEPNQAVDLRDLLAIRNVFGLTGPPGFSGADVDTNGVVDQADLLIWRQNFPYLGSPLAPYIFIADPLDGTLIGQRRPTILIDYGATTLNVDPDTLQIVVDGVDQTAGAIRTFTNAVLSLEQALADGPHFVEATIEDVQGTPATTRSDFVLSPLTLLPKVTPRMGPAPLAATFFPGVVWADNPPSQYLWDYDNNGTWDNGSIGAWDSSARPDLAYNTFYEEGLHTVRFGIYQGGLGLLTIDTIQVAVTESFASVSPSNGPGPLTVFLHGIAADMSDPITEYEWDFDYSGTFQVDYSSTTNPNTAHIYAAAGTYYPVFRTKHQSGAIVEHPIVQEHVQVKAPGAPTALAAAAQGADALTVNFSGSGTDNVGIVLYEWDYDNDGVYDYSSPTTGTVSHAYPTAGEKIAALRVTDGDGNTAVDRVRVETFAPAEVEILDDTVIPANNEQVAVRTTTTIDAMVNLYIRAEDKTLADGSILPGRIIRTLANEFRAAGMYEDTWDGRDFRYEPAHPGAYYAVLEYTYPGRTDVVDLADTSGGNHYFATRTTGNPSRFEPLEDDFWEMGFIIPSASRASLYILPGGNNRTDTPFDNLALGAGTYTYYWAGISSDGDFAPPVNHLWSVNAWTLGDNAIIVVGRPEVRDLTIEPNRYSPTDRLPQDPGVEINFTLTTKSTVILKIINVDSRTTLRTIQTEALAPGPQTIQWDGRSASGDYLAPGLYRLSFTAVDEKANASIPRDGLVEVRY